MFCFFSKLLCQYFCSVERDGYEILEKSIASNVVPAVVHSGRPDDVSVFIYLDLFLYSLSLFFIDLSREKRGTGERKKLINNPGNRQRG